MVSQLRPELFWDTDTHQLNSERHAQLIIERVAERGTLEEMRAIWTYYGADRIAAALQASRALTNRTTWFFATLFELPLSSFHSYQRGADHVAS